MSLDLIFIEHGVGVGRSIGATIDGHEIGLFYGVGAFKKLAPLIIAALPGRFADEDKCIAHLTTLHFRYMAAGVDDSGASYPRAE